VNQVLLTVCRELMEYFFDVCISEIVQMIKVHMERIAERSSGVKVRARATIHYKLS
jgi:hypothetical protein